jgi:uncharacterized Zn-finger protein
MQKNNSERENSTSGQFSAQLHYISESDLPLSCPLPSASQWNAHPRVFLTLDEEGKATCPYCSTVYILQQDD